MPVVELVVLLLVIKLLTTFENIKGYYNLKTN